MKLTKLFAALTLTLALLAGGLNLQAQCDKCPAGGSKSKCCDEAKKAGKACEKCAKGEKKETKKETK